MACRGIKRDVQARHACFGRCAVLCPHPRPYRTPALMSCVGNSPRVWLLVSATMGVYIYDRCATSERCLGGGIWRLVAQRSRYSVSFIRVYRFNRDLTAAVPRRPWILYLEALFFVRVAVGQSDPALGPFHPASACGRPVCRSSLEVTLSCRRTYGAASS